MNITDQNKPFAGILLFVPILLLIPLIAMQFTSEVQWKLMDFVVMGCLLTGAGIMAVFAWRKIHTKTGRIAAIVMILVGLLLVWAELAVGIFGTPFAGS